MDWKEKLRLGFAAFQEGAKEFGENAGKSISQALDNVQYKVDDFLDDPNRFTNEALAKVSDEVTGLASEFVTYVGAGHVSGGFYDWIMILSQVTTKHVRSHFFHDPILLS